MNSISAKSFQVLALSELKGVGPAALKRAVCLPAVDALHIEAIAEAIPTIGKATTDKDAWVAAQDRAAEQANQAAKIGVRILSPADEDYPPLLAATRDDPALIFVKGSLGSKSCRAVSVIGTREPTAHGAVVASRMATYFAENQWTVVSGLAIGCDAIAHQACLEVGGHTIAVLAHGLHMVAPTRHRKLAESILANGGALVSEFPVGQNAMPQQFVKRDRTQAGLAEGVVMIQSDIKGGSLHASRASLDYGRWLAIPYPTSRDMTNREPKTQANLILVDGTISEKTDLLRCKAGDLERVIPVFGKDDYPKLLHLSPKSERSVPIQRSLL